LAGTPKNEPKLQGFVVLRNLKMDSAVLCYTSLVGSYYTSFPVKMRGISLSPIITCKLH